MTIDQVRGPYQAVPFQPFLMHLADGRQVPVVHRDFIMASPNGQNVIVYQPDNSFNIIDLFLLTALEVKPEPQRSGK